MHHVLLGAGSAVDVSIYSPDGHSLTHKQFWPQICYTATLSFLEMCHLIHEIFYFRMIKHYHKTSFKMNLFEDTTLMDRL